MTPRVLAVGIQHSSRRTSTKAISKQRPATSQAVPTRLRSKIRAQIAEAKASGFDLDMMAIKPSQLESGLNHIRERLAKERPDLFIIGFGIRGSAELTVVLEQLVNACREISPETKIGFNTTFDGNLEVCERSLGKQRVTSD
jgi:hypothetical protein